MTSLSPCALALACLLAGVPIAAQQTPAPTRVVRFALPPLLRSLVTTGSCDARSIVADHRADAFRCTSAGVLYDPCFQVSHTSQVLCDVDPRDASSGVVLNLASALPNPSDHSSAASSAVWFFELVDGTTCKPLLTAGRVVEGMTELYTCKFALSAGDIDAVLGDLDRSGPVWTVQKIQINKKIEPQTIKSATTAAVRTAWQ